MEWVVGMMAFTVPWIALHWYVNQPLSSGRLRLATYALAAAGITAYWAVLNTRLHIFG